MSRLKVPVRRWGGNSVTRYNWETDTHNSASDWFFINYANDVREPGGASRRVLGGHVRRRDPRRGRRGADHRAPHRLDADRPRAALGILRGEVRRPAADGVLGHGVRELVQPRRRKRGEAGQLVRDGRTTRRTRRSPSDRISSRAGWRMSPGVSAPPRPGASGSGRSTTSRFSGTRRTTTSIRPESRTTSSGRRRRRSRPRSRHRTRTRRVLGPADWGWCAYFFSAADGCSPGADRAAHGEMDFLPWYLQQAKAWEVAHGVRILDYLDVHYYPQAGGVALTTTSPSGRRHFASGR